MHRPAAFMCARNWAAISGRGAQASVFQHHAQKLLCHGLQGRFHNFRNQPHDLVCGGLGLDANRNSSGSAAISAILSSHCAVLRMVACAGFESASA
jgi:hypothetical protein